jgi:CubicO group peptidase (beta-lactamase class C family)
MKTQLKLKFIFCIAATIILLSLLSYTQKKKDKVQPYDISAAIDAAVEEEMALQDITGMVVGVVQNGNIIHTKAYGYKDKLRTQPMTTSTVMRWASISKTVTAVAAFKAIENNKMALTDKVTKHVSYWPVNGNKDDITIAQLLSHRAGIVHYGYDENDVKICTYNQSAYTANNNFNAEQSVNVFKNCDLAFTPGTDYCYSTFGFGLLGAAVEGATGKAFEIYVDDNIADKAGMSSLTAYSADPGGFIKDCNTFLKSETEGDVEWKLPGGGWASNINDMADFLKGMVNGTFLNNTAALWNSVTGNAVYCYGINKEKLGSKTHVYHGGAHDDLRSYLGFFPDDKTGVCLMINHGASAEPDRFAKKLENVLGYNWNVSTAPIDYCGSSNNCGQTMTAVWRNTGKANDVLLRRGYTTDEFHEEWEKLTAAGYYADDIETWLDGVVRKWDGIFKKTTKKSAMWRGFTTDGWHDKWVEMNNQGYRLIDLETYLDGTVRKWAGTFIESTESYAMYRNMTTDEFGDKNTELKNENKKLIDIETYLDGTVRKWAGVWKGSGSSLLNRNYSEGDFITLRNDREAAGYKLLDVETYMDGTVRKWAGVWEAAGGDEHFRLDKKMCDLINTYHNVDKPNGYELMDIEKY